MSFVDRNTERQAKLYASGEAPVPARASTSVARDDTQGLYPQIPASLEIRKSDRSGRGLWTRKHFEPGSTVLAIEPHVFVLSNQYLDTHCSGCAKAGLASPLMRCSGCGTLRYCNASCQKVDWKHHKSECSAVQRWEKAAPSGALALPSDAVRCLGRMLWRIKSKGLDSEWTRELREMQSHKLSPQHLASIDSHTHLAHSVVRYLDLSAPSDLEEYGIMSASDLLSMISRFVINTVALTSPSLTPIGIAVSPLVALTNHSCLPNVAVVFPRSGKTKVREPVMTLVALRGVDAGEEISMGYIDTTVPKVERQTVLAETYNFTCECPLCNRAPSIVDPREAISCPKLCGGTYPVPNEEEPTSRCLSCSEPPADPHAVIDVVRIGREALEKAVRLQSSDAGKATQITTNMIPLLTSAGLAPSCHPLLALLKLHQSLLVSTFAEGISQERLDESIRASARYTAGLTAVLPEGHPVRGVALAELGKLLAVDEPAPASSASVASSTSFPPSGPARLRAAYDMLLKARNELLIGFGKENEGGEVGMEVRESIVALERELGVWTTGVQNVLEDTMKANRKA